MKKPSIERRVELSKLYTETCLKFGLADGNKAKEDEVGKETDGLDFTFKLSIATLLQLLAFVTVTEIFADEEGVTVIAEVVLPVLHVKVFDVVLNFVSSVTALS